MCEGLGQTLNLIWGIAQVMDDVGNSLVIRGKERIGSSAFVGSRRVISPPVVSLSNTYRTPENTCRKSELPPRISSSKGDVQSAGQVS